MNVKVLHAGTTLPPYTPLVTPLNPYPVPKVPRFTAAMHEVRLTFDTPTQQPRNTTSASTMNCYVVFEQASSPDTYGDAPRCAWLSPTGTLKVYPAKFRSTSLTLLYSFLTRSQLNMILSLHENF